jgi:PmbA protein
MNTRFDDHRQLASDLIRRLISKGAETAVTILHCRTEKEVTIRRQRIETLMQSDAKSLDLIVSKKQKKAAVSSCDFSAKSLDCLMDDVLALTEYTGVDEFYCLPDREDLGKADLDLDLFDPEEDRFSMEKRIEMARDLETKTLQHDKELIPDGASVNRQTGYRILANSLGFCEGYSFSHSSLCSSCAVPDGNEGWNSSRKQSGYWYDSNIHFHRLDSIENIAREAAERTLRKKGAVKPKTQKVPVIFENTVARSFLSYVAQAISGRNLYTKQSYLIDKLDRKIAGENITVIDDPLIPGQLGSRPFDAEGVMVHRKTVIEKGVLRSYLLDTYSGKKLAMKNTGNAGGPGNFYMEPGSYTLEQLIASIDTGVLITSLAGFGAVIHNGDFSQGAQGFWIEKGKIAYPVNEFTIASTFPEILGNIEMIGNDPLRSGSIQAPSFKIKEMTISGT